MRTHSSRTTTLIQIDRQGDLVAVVEQVLPYAHRLAESTLLALTASLFWGLVLFFAAKSLM